MKKFTSFICLIAFSMPCIARGPQTPESKVEGTGNPVSQPAATDVAVGAPHDWKQPVYPKHAMQNKIQGSVALRLSLDKKGRVTNVSVLSGDPELADAATRAVYRWKYAPYFRENTPVEVTTLMTLNFKIGDSGRPEITAKYEEPALSGVFRVGGAVRAPKALYSPYPEYSDEARSLKYEGVCVLALIVGTDGMPRDIKIVRSLGHGLDERAIQAVQHWRFSPAKKEGNAVPVLINVELQFKLFH